jgi:hypothetical protein
MSDEKSLHADARLRQDGLIDEVQKLLLGMRIVVTKKRALRVEYAARL